jgi:Rnl2 family RNA ligase
MNKYNSIENLYKVNEIMAIPEVYIEEKLHGTNTRIGIDEFGNITPGGRNLEFNTFTQDEIKSGCIIYTKHPDDSYSFTHFLLTNGYLEKLAQRDWNGITIYGEFIGPGIQKGVSYGTEKQFYVIDIYDDSLERWFHRDNVESICNSLGLKVVPCLYRGKPDIEIFNQWYQANSTVGFNNGVEGENICEGIVVKPLVPCTTDRFGNRLIAKYKNEKWAEKAKQKVNDKEPTDNTAYNHLVAVYVNHNRLDHVIQHLTEDGKITSVNLTAAGEVVREMINDVMKEADQEDLFGIDPKRVGKFIGPATIKLFKEKLINDNLS